MWRYLPLISRECCFGSSFGQFDNLENEVGHFLMAVCEKQLDFTLQGINYMCICNTMDLKSDWYNIKTPIRTYQAF